MKFLIVKTSSLGDVVQSFPVLHFLKDRFPEAQVDWVVEEQCVELVKRHPLVDRTLVIQTRKWRKGWWRLCHLREISAFREELQKHRYTAAFDLQGNVKSSIVNRMALADEKVGFGTKSAAEWPNTMSTTCQFDLPPGMSIRDDYLYLVRQWANDEAPFQDPGVSLRLEQNERELLLELMRSWGKRRILVCHGSRWKNKQLSEEAFQDFLQRLLDEASAQLLFAWGSEEERASCERMAAHVQGDAQVLPKLTLPSLQHVMQEVDQVISVDSLALHLAASTNTPTFSVFGASSAEKYAPRGDQHRCYQGACPYGKTFEKRCPMLRNCETGACIQSLSGADLYRGYYTNQMSASKST